MSPDPIDQYKLAMQNRVIALFVMNWAIATSATRPTGMVTATLR